MEQLQFILDLKDKFQYSEFILEFFSDKSFVENFGFVFWEN